MSKARRQRKKERKRMMEDFHPELAEDGDYYSCSQMQEHGENCREIDESHPAWEYGFKRVYSKDRGELGCEVVTKWDVGIGLKKMEFIKAGLDPNAVSFPAIIMKAQIGAMMDAMIEHGMVDEKELDLHYQKNFYNLLKETSENLVPMIQEQRRNAIVAKPGDIPPPRDPGKPRR